MGKITSHSSAVRFGTDNLCVVRLSRTEDLFAKHSAGCTCVASSHGAKYLVLLVESILSGEISEVPVSTLPVSVLKSLTCVFLFFTDTFYSNVYVFASREGC